MKSSLLPIVAILCITLIEVLAIREGLDGLVLAGALGVIGAIVGRWTKSKKAVINK